MFALWNLDFAAALLNLKVFPETVPTPLAGVITAESLDRGRAYLRTNSVFNVIRASVSLALLIAFWMLGGFQQLDETSRALAHGGPVTSGLVFFALCMLGITLLGLPFSWYHTFVIEEKFGFNRSTPGTFWGDQIKGLLMMAVLGLPIGAAVLWIFQHVPHAWLWAWAAFTLFQLLLTWLAPSLILPLFNKFTPMPDGDLKRRIEELGTRCGFPLDGVFVMDGSKRSTKANAFFTGFGKRKKIALFDTLMEKHSDDELLGVLAHEIGHFRRGHIRQRLLVGIVQSAALFFLLGLATDPHGAFARQLFDAFGVKTISPQMGIVLFTLLFDPVSRLLGVFANAWSRRHEFEADAYAAEVTGDPMPLADALKKLSADQLSHPSPHPLRVWLDYSHPPLIERLAALERGK
ncbi:M48 family metallopeptidase [Luteolibacter sp. LG18]|uniref:M48 family metallopeptidase n=1 Tax=Luteolibacter sp. LG18 TaxID=2819286 RepID=UPI002B30E2AB|nr:peptidase M48 [Luteolibacter sp. LG18]